MREMEPGSELDKLIHDKVFGNPKPLINCQVTRVKSIDLKNGTVTLEKQSLIPPYSTSIEAAWEVVEKMEGRFFRLSALRSPTEDIWTGFICDIGRVSVCAKTAPLAICLAALKYIEGTK